MKLNWLQVGFIGSIVFTMLIQSYGLNAQEYREISEDIVAKTSEILPDKCDSYTVEKSFTYSSNKNIGSLDNDAALKALRKSYASPITDLINQENMLYLNLGLSEERKERLDAWRKKYDLENKAKAKTEAAQLEILCSYARFLHYDYIVNPEQLNGTLTAAYKYYKKLKPKDVAGRMGQEEEVTLKVLTDDDNYEYNRGRSLSSFGWAIIIGIINLLLLFGVAYYFYSQLIKAERYIDSKIENQSKILANYALNNKLIEPDLIKLVQDNAVTEDALEKTLKRLKEENDILYQKNQHFEKLSTEETSTKTPVIVEETQWNNEKAKEVTSFLLAKYDYKYATLIHNTFQERHIFDKSRTGSTFYELLISKEELNTGLFRLTSDIYNLKMALSKPKDYIESACSLEGNGDISEAKSIYCFPGKIKKDGTQWKIEEKAIIQYEV